MVHIDLRWLLDRWLGHYRYLAATKECSMRQRQEDWTSVVVYKILLDDIRLIYNCSSLEAFASVEAAPSSWIHNALREAPTSSDLVLPDVYFLRPTRLLWRRMEMTSLFVHAKHTYLCTHFLIFYICPLCTYVVLSVTKSMESFT